MEDGPGPAAPDLCDLHDPEVCEGQDGESLSRWVSSRSRGGLCRDPTESGPGHCDEWHGRDLQPGPTAVSELLETCWFDCKSTSQLVFSPSYESHAVQLGAFNHLCFICGLIGPNFPNPTRVSTLTQRGCTWELGKAALLWEPGSGIGCCCQSYSYNVGPHPLG